MSTGPRRDLFHLLSHAEQHAARLLAGVLEAEDCSVEQWRVLALLADGTGRPMTELAEFALLLAPTATKLVDRMVSASLVYRRADPADRRRVLVYLAERGQDLHARLTGRVARLEEELGADAELRARLARLAESEAVLARGPGTAG